MDFIKSFNPLPAIFLLQLRTSLSCVSSFLREERQRGEHHAEAKAEVSAQPQCFAKSETITNLHLLVQFIQPYQLSQAHIASLQLVSDIDIDHSRYIAPVAGETISSYKAHRSISIW